MRLLPSIAMLALAASSAFAQDPVPASAPPPAPVVAGWNDGFFVQSANGDYRLVLGMVAQADGRFALGEAKPIVNTFTVRKLRPTFSGRIAKYFDFKVMPDFGNGTAVVQDMYLDVRFSPKFRIRTGKDKTPVGYEVLIGDGNLFFPERALASSLAPNRDIGIQVQGDLSPKLYYAAGVFNGIPDGTSSTTEVDTNSTKDLAGRVVIQPFRSAAAPNRPLNNFGFQIGGSNGQQAGALPSFKTSVGQTYFSYTATATATGTRNRVAPAIFYYYKGFGTFVEYFKSTQVITKANVRTDVANTSWDITTAIDLTGEPASIAGLRPKANFDPPNGKGGALQLVLRYTALTVGQDAFTDGLATPGSSRKAKSFTIGTNWYPAPYIKYYFTYERTVFDDNDGTRPTEKVFLLRAQLAF